MNTNNNFIPRIENYVLSDGHAKPSKKMHPPRPKQAPEPEKEVVSRDYSNIHPLALLPTPSSKWMQRFTREEEEF